MARQTSGKGCPAHIAAQKMLTYVDGIRSVFRLT